MGRIDPAAPRRARGLGSAAGRIVAGALAVLLLAFGIGCTNSTKERYPLDRKTAALILARSKLVISRSRPWELYEVSGVAVDPGGKTAHVEFEWFFADMTAEQARKVEATFRGSALFRLYDDGWRVDDRSLAETLLTSPRVEHP